MLSPLFVTSSIQLLWFKENTNFLRRHKYYTHGLQCSKLSTNIKYKKYPTTIALTTGFRFIDRDQVTDHQVLICSDDVKMSLQSCFLEMLPVTRQLVVTNGRPSQSWYCCGSHGASIPPSQCHCVTDVSTCFHRPASVHPLPLHYRRMLDLWQPAEPVLPSMPPF